MLDPDSKVSLKKIAPSKLVGDTQDDLEDFFLVLAVIYNDLKGLVHLNKDFMDGHPAPQAGELSAYLGEYNGMTSQSYKILAGLINEFFIFLKEHEHIYQLSKFKLILLRVPKSRKSEWEAILSAALEKPDKHKPGSLAYKLMIIRNNVGFHYHQSEKVLRDSFKEFFGDKDKPGADHAYYSLGETMQDTRFYYADAAVQRFLLKTASEKGQVDYEKTLPPTLSSKKRLSN